LEHFSDQVDEALISDAFSQAIEDHLVSKTAKAIRYVTLNDPRCASPVCIPYMSECCDRAAFWAESMGTVPKNWFIDGV
jgi:alanine dehydrogenase